MSLFNNFIVTTASQIEGYRIVYHLGVVYGDAIHKPNFMAMTSSRTASTVHAMFFGSMEMKDTEKLVNEARAYAFSQLMKNAKQIGGNAIVGFVSNNNIGNDIMHISLYGTAVKIIPEKEYEEQQKTEAEKQEQKRIEQQQKEIQSAALLKEAQQRKADGDMNKEIGFLNTIREIDSMMKIWTLWTESGLGNTYREIDSLIKRARDQERMYGRMPSDTERLKKQIEKALLEI